MWEALKNIGGWLADSTNGVNNGIAVAGGLGNLWDAYNQNKMAKKQFGLQQDAYNFNKMLSERQLRRQDKADESLEQGWANSTYASRV